MPTLKMRHMWTCVTRDPPVPEGLRGEESIAELCRWSKEFLEAGKKRLAGDTAPAASLDEMKELRREPSALKELVGRPDARRVEQTYK
jgi:hypothetical protein